MLVTLRNTRRSVSASSLWATWLVFTTLPLTTQLAAQARDPAAPTHEAPGAAPAALEIVPPRALSTRLNYPEGASGSEAVELILTVGASGRVVDVQVLAGNSPFREAAALAAQSWQFEPARRGEQAVSARIRYLAQFTPQTEPATAMPEPEPAPAPSQPVGPRAPHAAAAPRPVEIVVEGQRAPAGSVVLTREETRSVPGSFGDPLRAIEAQPGVVPIVSGLPAFFIRGAPPANVGFFFEGIELPLLYHAFFGPSVVHPGFIDSIEFYPGSSPAEYGRFAGPVVAVNARPLRSRPTGEASLRLIDAGGLIESGPFRDCHAPTGLACSSGIRAAGRYSYAGAVLSLLSDAKLDYWDYQTLASYPLGDHDAVSVLAFGAYDLFRPPQTSVNTGAELSFHRVDVRWDRELGSGSALRVAVTGGYDRAAGSDVPARILTDRSLRIRTELTQRLGAHETLRAGLDGRFDRFQLEADARSLNYLDFARLFPTRTDGVAGGYVSFQLDPARGIHVAPGLRADVYSSQGVTAVGVDPRVSAEVEVSRALRLEHSIGIAHQRPNFASQVPGAQVADLANGLQWALLWSSGVRVRLPFGLTASATVFRSAYFHVLDPIGGARDFTIDQTTLQRRSTVSATGLELHLARPITRRLGGFISYTLSRSEESTGSQKSPSGFDRPHVFQAALSYDFGRGFVVGARTVLYSGVPELNLEGTPHFTSQRRGAPFFRLDLRAEKRFHLGQNGYWGVTGEMLNATSSREVVRLDCGEVCRARSAGPVILPSVGLEAGF